MSPRGPQSPTGMATGILTPSWVTVVVSRGVRRTHLSPLCYSTQRIPKTGLSMPQGLRETDDPVYIITLVWDPHKDQLKMDHKF